MKKALSLVLSVLVLFSCLAIGAAADGEVYTVKFVDYDGKVLSEEIYNLHDVVLAPDNPSRAADEEKNVEYIFKGWQTEGDPNVYHAGTMPIVTGDAVYTAVYVEKEIPKSQTFWNVVRDFFARINMIFQYFFEIFSRDNPWID